MNKVTLEDFYSIFEIRKLKSGECLDSFRCGDEDLDDFIAHDVALYKEALLAVTYVLERKDNKEPVAYFSLANDRIALRDFPDNTEFNRFRRHRFVNKKRLKNYPAVKLCRFAVSQTIKGQSVGSFLLDYMKSWFVDDNKTGCRFLTVDAYSSAEPFYLHNGFFYLSSQDENKKTRLMFFDLINIED